MPLHIAIGYLQKNHNLKHQVQMNLHFKEEKQQHRIPKWCSSPTKAPNQKQMKRTVTLIGGGMLDSRSTRLPRCPMQSSVPLHLCVLVGGWDGACTVCISKSVCISLQHRWSLQNVNTPALSGHILLGFPPYEPRKEGPAMQSARPERTDSST